MKIGIDISQVAFSQTGVANFVKNLSLELVKNNTHEYVLFASSLRRKKEFKKFNEEFKSRKNVEFKIFPFPPKLLDLLWNKLHIFPVENLLGDIDVFIASDWTQPPTKRAKKATILYDLIVYTTPKETAEEIVKVQKRRLEWVKKESDMVFCISEATKKDAEKFLEIPPSKLVVIYPGITR